MKRWLWLVLCMGLLVLPVAAQDDDDETTLPGSVAYIGTDGNVYTYNFAADTVYPLTDDGGRLRQYQWPTWSQGGELAYFCCDAAAAQPFLETFVSVDGVTVGDVVNVSDGAIFTYAAWSPRGCDASEGCRDLAVLQSLLGEGVFGVDIIRTGAEADIQRVGQGAPFYYSWSPDGERLLLQRNTRSIGVYTVADDDIELYDTVPGVFPAPAWSPVDDRLLVGILNESRRSTDLAVLVGQKVEVLVDDLPGEVAFNWSPDGNYVAFRTLGEAGGTPVTVIDTITGEIVATSGFDDAFSFFWSPDSRYVAYITFASPRGSFNVSNFTPTLEQLLMQEDGLQWAVLDVTTGETRTYGSFIPTNEMIYLLSFFNQFAQSHSVWSPDSSHIVFSEISIATAERQIAILDITRPDAVPFFIAEGVIGIWSYR